MIGYVLRRVLQLLPVLLLASVGIWAMLYAVPGGPVGMILGENATPEQIAALRAELGLDRPVVFQYLDWLTNVFRGDLGLSIHSREPVLELIMHRLPATLQLAFAAMIVAMLLGVPGRRLRAAVPRRSRRQGTPRPARRRPR